MKRSSLALGAFLICVNSAIYTCFVQFDVGFLIRYGLELGTKLWRGLRIPDVKLAFLRKVHKLLLNKSIVYSHNLGQ